METCKTCRYWEELTYEGEGTGAGKCPHVLSGVGPNQWAVAGGGAELEPITTGSEFWCRHHEPKGDGK